MSSAPERERERERDREREREREIPLNVIFTGSIKRILKE